MIIDHLKGTSTDSFVSTATDIWGGLRSIVEISQTIFDNASRRYYFTLTGGDSGLDDIEIPISSFQTQQEVSGSSYLSVVIPGIEHSQEIIDRSSGELILEMAYWFNGQDYYRTEIFRADYDDLRIDRGGTNKTLSLSGYKTVVASPITVPLRSNYTYTRLLNGKRTYRFPEPDISLKVGDTVEIDSESIQISSIVCWIAVNSSQMEITEG